VRDYYKIHYIHSGKGVFRAGGQTYFLSRGQGFLICPDMLAFYRADDLDPWSYSWVAFNGMQVEYYLKRSHLSQTNPIFFSDQEEHIQNCFLEMFRANEQELNKELRMLGALYSFLSVVLDASPVSENNSDAKGHYVGKALEFIEMNYARSISVEDIACDLRLSRKYVSKLFKESVGLSPQQYIVQYRMTRACTLLKDSQLAISEVAVSVGYADALLFSRMFRRVKGVSPSQFRQQ
jgi:AraC-like DNA-binding protein